jgi:hypothetical protein
MFHRGFLNTISVPATASLQHAPFRVPLTVRRLQVDLDGFEVPQAVLWLIPLSLAYENAVLPIGLRDRTLVMAAREPLNADILSRVQFILNRRVVLVPADGKQVMEAINRFCEVEV